MKKIIAIIIVIFIFFGISGGIIALKTIGTSIGLGLFSIFKIMPHLPTSIFDLFEKGLVESWSLTGNHAIDSGLLNIALLIPSVIISIIAIKGFKMSKVTSTVISLVMLVVVLELFSLCIFWIIIAISIVFCVLKVIYIKYKKFNDKEEKINVQKVKQENINQTEENGKKSDRLYNIFELWDMSNSSPFKAYSHKTKVYVYINKDPKGQYNLYGKVYGDVSYSFDTYNKGKNTEVFNVADNSWEIV